jgi:hypothetical protein
MVKMAYRINAQFTDGFLNGWLSDIVAAPAPRCGETISVSRFGRDVAMCVTAVWTPSKKFRGKDTAVVVMVEACEVWTGVSTHGERA